MGLLVRKWKLSPPIKSSESTEVPRSKQIEAWSCCFQITGFKVGVGGTCWGAGPVGVVGEMVPLVNSLTAQTWQLGFDSRDPLKKPDAGLERWLSS